MMRKTMALWLMLTVMVSTGAAQPARADAASVSFSIPDSVSGSDAVQVRSGVQFARDYVEETYRADLLDDLIVNVRATADSTDPSVIAFASGDSLVVFTGSPGWTTMSPSIRLAVMVHEYTHILQRDAIRSGTAIVPLWFIEGMAHYVAFNAIASIGLIEPLAVRDEQRWMVSMTGDAMPPLRKLEDTDDFQHASVDVYSLSFLAIQRLVGDGDPDCLWYFLKLIGVGETWQQAFSAAFDVDVDAFYDTFQSWVRKDLVAPKEEPVAFQFSEPAQLDADALIRRAPTSAAAGTLVTVLAKTEPDANCTFTVTDSDGGQLERALTHADPTGLVYWLGDVQIDSNDGPMTVAVDCGGRPDLVQIDIEPPSGEE